jgi:type IV pilus assembly protein PilX
MAEKMNTILRNQSGAALVIALIMIIVITLIALASSYTSIFEIKISGNKRGLTDAFYAADAGINAITAYPTASFNTSAYTLLPSNTAAQYNNFSFTNLGIPNPANIPNSNVALINYTNQSGPPRGGGYSAVNVNYAYFQVQCTGNDTVGSGAQATVQEDVIELVPIPQ